MICQPGVWCARTEWMHICVSIYTFIFLLEDTLWPKRKLLYEKKKCHTFCTRIRIEIAFACCLFPFFSQTWSEKSRNTVKVKVLGKCFKKLFFINT